MTIYDLLRVLVDDSSITNKEGAYELIQELQGTAAFGSVASTTQTDGSSHSHIPQQEWENELHQRLVQRCATCRIQLCEPWWPDGRHSYGAQEGNYGTNWR